MADSGDGAGARALYRHFDGTGRLLYVGISLSVIVRLSGHKRSPWFGDIARVEIDTTRRVKPH